MLLLLLCVFKTVVAVIIVVVAVAVQSAVQGIRTIQEKKGFHYLDDCEKVLATKCGSQKYWMVIST